METKVARFWLSHRNTAIIFKKYIFFKKWNVLDIYDTSFQIMI